MKKQEYSNHIKYYYPHHFVFYPVGLFFMGVSIRNAMKYPERSMEWMALAAIFFLVMSLSFMMRQHYALSNQNRIVRLELRLRYYQLTLQRLEDIEERLSFSQLAALRFAPDEELPALIQQAVDLDLPPDKIKRSIKNWLPDTMRV